MDEDNKHISQKIEEAVSDVFVETRQQKEALAAIRNASATKRDSLLRYATDRAQALLEDVEGALNAVSTGISDWRWRVDSGMHGMHGYDTQEEKIQQLEQRIAERDRELDQLRNEQASNRSLVQDDLRLAKDQLAQLQKYCAARAAAAQGLFTEVEMHDMLNGNQINAIKNFRARTGFGLKLSKELVEMFVNEKTRANDIPF